ncbi:DUF5445 family protein [Escherichia coli]|nr:DUF5445 family protein [Escherichia coli]
MVCFLIYITLLFIQRVYFISSEKKLTIHIVQMFQLLSQAFYNLKMFLMMDMLGVGDAININTYAKRINGVLCIYSQLSVGQIWRA